jgi:hypothetical protein
MGARMDQRQPLPPAVLVSRYPDLGYVPMSEGVQFNLFTVERVHESSTAAKLQPSRRDWMRK